MEKNTNNTFGKENNPNWDELYKPVDRELSHSDLLTKLRATEVDVERLERENADQKQAIIQYNNVQQEYLAEIEELMTGLQIAFDFISLSANSYKLTNNKTSGEDVFRMLQARGSELKEHKLLNKLLTKK